MSAPLPATGMRSDELLELAASMRKELVQRGEVIPSSWVEESVEDLTRGRVTGLVLPAERGGPALAFYSLRPGRAYGHVHIAGGKVPVTAAVRLIAGLVATLPPELARMDVGITGVPSEDEAHLSGHLVRLRGGALLGRSGLDRSVPTAAAELPHPLPTGYALAPLRSVPFEDLAALDWAGYRGTPDESLVSDTREENDRVLREVLGGLLGRFLDDASFALLDEEGKLVGAVLTSEKSAREALFVDLIVAPSQRRRGLATLLLSQGLRALRALGYQTVRLWATDTNAAALGLYRKLGFAPVVHALIFRYTRPTPATGAQPQ